MCIKLYTADTKIFLILVNIYILFFCLLINILYHRKKKSLININPSNNYLLIVNEVKINKSN